ncbi:hypothetical protein H7170_01800 [Candidatus Gracilibacteria bacterium]|nr:hypothetical protein [Candidatus Gracilibacteria bacterium]
MKIYFDSHCRICRRIAVFCQDHAREPLVFVPIRESIYATYEHDTIVVSLEGAIYTYGAALRIIFRCMSYPYRFLAYVPVGILDFLYYILRYMRRYL